ncbi:MAG TPA: SlyX family protein [Phycisphaerales bacterium]|nr:SlyX family protein [Phycisphaerales bacterium]
MQDPEARLTKLEESQAFGERAAEELSEQIREMHRRIDLLVKRLAAMEERVRRAAEGGGEEVADEAGD